MRILLVEDNETDVFLLRHAFQDHELQADLEVITDGGVARDFILQQQAPKPELIILDINLPKVDGLTLLGLIRKSERMAGTLVVILTSSQADEDKRRALELGADAFLTKAGTLNDFLALGGVFKEIVQQHGLAAGG